MQKIFLLILICFSCSSTFASPNETELAVWANEAIVATYTFTFKDYIGRQREIAKYFTAEGWANYSTALINSNLPNAVQKNSYTVNSVATMPPKIKTINNTAWQAVMPILVIYKNPQYQQKQMLQVTINFKTTPSGVRGLAIESLESKVIEAPCVCEPPKPTPIVEKKIPTKRR